MKQFILTLSFSVLFIGGFALNTTFDIGVFMTPDKDSYVETYMLFDASEVHYVLQSDSSFLAALELTYIFEQDGQVKDYSKTVVRSACVDTLNALSDFVDQQRFFLDRGNYEVTVKVKDLNNPSDSLQSKISIGVSPSPIDPVFSKVVLIDRVEDTEQTGPFTRAGRNMYPKVAPFFAPGVTQMLFYTELYNIDQLLGEGSPFAVDIQIRDIERNAVIGTYRLLKRKEAGAVVPITGGFNIEELKTGTYALSIEARDKNNQVVTSTTATIKRFHFDEAEMEAARNLSFVDDIGDDSLRTFCYCLIYQANEAEAAFISSNWQDGDIDTLRSFFHGFWSDREPLYPALAWKRYERFIAHVEDAYGNNTQHGCGTDRGRIYLKYGKPNSMSIVRNEAHAYPYEIWHYYKIPEKSNAKFFFFDPKRLNEFRLTHSNVTGEPKDQLWYTRVVSGTPVGSASSDEHTREVLGVEKDPYSHGSRALDYWNNPR